MGKVLVRFLLHWQSFVTFLPHWHWQGFVTSLSCWLSFCYILVTLAKFSQHSCHTGRVPLYCCHAGCFRYIHVTLGGFCYIPVTVAKFSLNSCHTGRVSVTFSPRWEGFVTLLSRWLSFRYIPVTLAGFRYIFVTLAKVSLHSCHVFLLAGGRL